jgi:hypothetical protein
MSENYDDKECSNCLSLGLGFINFDNKGDIFYLCYKCHKILLSKNKKIIQDDYSSIEEKSIQLHIKYLEKNIIQLKNQMSSIENQMNELKIIIENK